MRPEHDPVWLTDTELSDVRQRLRDGLDAARRLRDACATPADREAAVEAGEILRELEQLFDRVARRDSDGSVVG